jgi:serine/threonine protein kinase
MGLMSSVQPTFYCSHCLNTFQVDAESCPNMGCGRFRPADGWAQMFEPGEVIDRNYQVAERLATGGAGVTYLVRALSDDGKPTGPKIALKLLFTARDHGAYLRRLSTEAQILQELQHPNIVQYLGFVHRTGQSPYLLTQFEEGGSLLDHMRRVGTLGIRDVASVGRQVCWALEKGHAQGIIHRDLKPENLLLETVTPKGEVPIIRVADFGIAKVSGSLASGLTRAGAFVGTPQYAAPEQFVGDPASDKADIYALGAVMVFMLTARPLVQDAHILASEDVYTRLLDSLPPTIQCKNDTAEDNRRFNQILVRAMAVNPDERCSVGELDRMLAALLEDCDPQAPVMTLSAETPVASIPLSVFSDASSGLTVSGLVQQDIVANPTPTLRDPTIEMATIRSPLASSSPLSPEDSGREPPAESPVVDRKSGVLGLKLFLVCTVLAALGLGALGWMLYESSESPVVPVKEPADELVEALSVPPIVEEPVAAVEVPLAEAEAEKEKEKEKEKAASKKETRAPPVVQQVLDAVRNPSEGEDARRAADRAFKRNAQIIRRNCPEAVGQRIEIETVVGIHGRIQWARPLVRTRPEFKCVADNMKSVQSGSRLKIATKVRLHVQP